MNNEEHCQQKRPRENLLRKLKENAQKMVEQIMQKEGILQRIVENMEELKKTLLVSMSLTKKSEIAVDLGLKTVTPREVEMINQKLLDLERKMIEES